MPLIQELDYGTPVVSSDTTVTLTIDGQAVTVPAGTSIMRAAMEAGTKIPKLCATDSLNSFGKIGLHPFRNLNPEILLKHISHSAFSGLTVDANNRLLGTTDILRIDWQIRNRP